MYLHEEMEDMDGKIRHMAGVIPEKSRVPDTQTFQIWLYFSSQKKTVLGERIWERFPLMNFIILIRKTAAEIFMHRSRKAPEDGSVFMERTLFLQASRICIIMEIPEYRRRF